MATLVQQYNMGQDGALRARVAAAIQQTAALVRPEPLNQPYPNSVAGAAMNASHAAKRQQLVITANVAIQGIVDAFARQVANNVTCQGQATFNADGTANSTAAVTDANILFVVASAWDLIAGVLPSETP